MNRIKKFLKKLYHIIRKPEMKILPGNVAFFLVLSIIPIITLIGICASGLSIPTDAISNFMNRYFPNEVSTILTPFLSGQGLDLNVIIFTIMGFILASNGANAIILATNNIYGISNISTINRRVKSFTMTIVLVFLIVFLLAFLTFGNMIMNFLTNHIFGGENIYIYYLYLSMKWPIAFFFIFFLVKLIYTMAPNKRIPSAHVNKGAIFTTVGWSLVTLVFSYYATNIANYDRFYGNLSSIIILMMWIYIIAYVFTLGMAINRTNYNYMDEKANKLEENNS